MGLQAEVGNHLMKTTYCDFCGKPTDERFSVAIHNSGQPGEPFSLAWTPDICGECVSRLQTIAENGDWKSATKPQSDWRNLAGGAVLSAENTGFLAALQRKCAGIPLSPEATPSELALDEWISQHVEFQVVNRSPQFRLKPGARLPAEWIV